MNRKRRVYSPKFKSQIGLEALKERLTLSELAEKHQLHANQISTWKQIIAQNSEELFDKKRGKKTAKDQGLTDQLYEQIGRLQMELSWLKKKSVLEY